MDNRTIEQIRDNETKLIKELQQKENIIKEIYAKANDTNITSLDLREYILDNLGSESNE